MIDSNIASGVYFFHMAIAEQDLIARLKGGFGDEDPNAVVQTPVVTSPHEQAKARTAELLALREEEVAFLNENPWLLEAAREVGDVLREQVGRKVAVDPTKAAGDERPAGIAITWGWENPKGSTWIADRVFCAVHRDVDGNINGVQVGSFLFPGWWNGDRTPEIKELAKQRIAAEVLRVGTARQQTRSVSPPAGK